MFTTTVKLLRFSSLIADTAYQWGLPICHNDMIN